MAAERAGQADISTSLETVNLREAAQLVHRTERNVRRRMRREVLTVTPVGAPRKGAGPPQWSIKVADLAKVPGWTVDPDTLTRLQLQKQATTTETSPSALVEIVASPAATG
jgi:hypothetical protein